MNVQNYLLLLSIGISLFIAGLSLRHSTSSRHIHLAAIAFAVAVWGLSYLVFYLQIVRVSTLLFISIVYLSSTVAGSGLLTFSLLYRNRFMGKKWLTLVLLAIEPVATQLLFWNASSREVLFTETGNGSAGLSFNTGIWGQINTLYLYGFEIVSVVLFAASFSRRPGKSFLRAGALLMSVFMLLVFRMVSEINQPPNGLFDPMLIGYSLALIGLTYGLHQNNAAEAMPLTYETAIQGMNDGWMVLDLNNNIVDVNPAAEKIVGISRQYLYGKPVRSILPDWPDISHDIGGGKELEMRRSIRSQGNWRYLNVRLSNLKDNAGESLGQLIIWRDITERRLAEEARRRARDEMFVLINAISNAASHSIKLDDFLSESIYQLIYAFQSQVVVVLLIEDPQEHHQDLVLRLAAHFGLASPGVKDEDIVFDPVHIFIEVLTSRQPLVIANDHDPSRIPTVLKEAGIASLVILPLFTQAGENSRLLGSMLLGRKGTTPYSPDEVIRLVAIAEQISNLIDSDRRRQLAIALSEREKLMRDLHDSVSQKLYGLVTLTEAAQAGLEAGSKIIPSQVLAKIGENARQAVKEMRLFLYQMQPVDLEKGGLVSALHHRLGAVEGRADIQARFLPDEGIHMSKDKEVALYYIAQEALNNILKHAHANSVLVKLKRARKNVILEIVDNGQGFNPKNIDQSGMGLQNMKARATLVNGKLRITSKPGAGTAIRVTVGRERSPIRTRNR
jgi:PAS domain S-box-containing protein